MHPLKLLDPLHNLEQEPLLGVLKTECAIISICDKDAYRGAFAVSYL